MRVKKKIYASNFKFTIHSNEIFYLFTVVVGEDVEKPVVDGRRADALLAAHYAQEAALRLCKPGNEVISLRHYFDETRTMGVKTYYVYENLLFIKLCVQM